MRQLADLMFANDTSEVIEHYPRKDGSMSLILMRVLFGSYVLVGKDRFDNFWDISREGGLSAGGELGMATQRLCRRCRTSSLALYPWERGTGIPPRPRGVRVPG